MERHGSDQPHWQRHVVIATSVSFNEILQKEGHVTHLEVATMTYFMGDVGRNVL
jgi:hypothetical protein